MRCHTSALSRMMSRQRSCARILHERGIERLGGLWPDIMVHKNKHTSVRVEQLATLSTPAQSTDSLTICWAIGRSRHARRSTTQTLTLGSTCGRGMTATMRAQRRVRHQGKCACRGHILCWTRTCTFGSLGRLPLLVRPTKVSSAFARAYQ